MKPWTPQQLVEKVDRLAQLQQWSEEQVTEANAALGASDEVLKLAFCSGSDQKAILLLQGLRRLGPGTEAAAAPGAGTVACGKSPSLVGLPTHERRGVRLRQDDDNPDLFLLEPLDGVSAGAFPHKFFLDPSGRLTKELTAWLRLVERCYREGKPIPPLFVNGLIKSGKSYLLNVILPALARAHYTSRGGGSGGSGRSGGGSEGNGGRSGGQAVLPEPNVLAVDCLGCTRLSGVGGFLRDFLIELKRSAAAQQLSAAASTPVPADLSGASMVDAIHQFMRNLPRDRVTFLLIDEAHSFYLLQQAGPGKPSLDTPQIRYMRRVLKGLLLDSPPWVAWAVTGSHMGTLWANVAATPPHGLPLIMHHFPVSLDAEASRETLAVAWEQLQIQHAAANPPLPPDLVWQSPPHHAMLAFMCKQWTIHGGGDARTAAQLVRQTWMQELLLMAEADLRLALQVLQEPDMQAMRRPRAPLLLLRELLDPHCGVPRYSLSPVFEALLRSYTTEREGRLVMENTLLRETLQAVTNESGELVTIVDDEALPSLSSALYRELLVLGERCKQDPPGDDVHLDGLLGDMAAALPCTADQLLHEPCFIKVLNHRCNSQGAKQAFEETHRDVAVQDAVVGLRQYHGLLHSTLAHGTLSEQREVLEAYPPPLKAFHADGRISRALTEMFTTRPAPIRQHMKPRPQVQPRAAMVRPASLIANRRLVRAFGLQRLG